MFYGTGRTGCSGSGGDLKGNPKNRFDRYEQMGKQQELIEQKKREIEAKLQAERHKQAMEALLAPPASAAVGPASSSAATSSATGIKLSSSNPGGFPGEREKPPPVVPIKANVFANDGSFFEQFKKMQEQQKKQELETKVKEEPVDEGEYGDKNARKSHVRALATTEMFGSPSKEYRDKSSVAVPPPSFYNDALSDPPPPPPPRPSQHHHSSAYRNENYDYPPPPPPPPPPRRSPSPNRLTQNPPGFPSMAVKDLAARVAEGGDHVEERARVTNKDSLLWFLYRPDSAEYRKFRELVMSLRSQRGSSDSKHGFVDNRRPPESASLANQPFEKRLGSSVSSSGDEEEEKYSAGQKRKRSRWGPQSDSGNLPPPAIFHELPGAGTTASFVQGVPPPVPPPPPPPMVPPPNAATHLQLGFSHGGAHQEIGHPLMQSNSQGFVPNKPTQQLRGPPPMLTKITNPQLLAYARQSYGTVDLDDEQWKQCEEAYKMNLLFQDIARKKARDEQLKTQGKFKHEYDSDEDVDDKGTWEHKQRMKEMEKTKEWANELTSKAKGKHHIGDFLPPEELSKFMDKYKAVKEGRQMDESAYQDFKIAQDNVGFKLLQKMGWSQGQGLGAESQGIVDPIQEGGQGADKTGLGVEKPSELQEDDDEYSAYRKRMMLAYRFRPNPLNNPRRAYY